MYQKPPLGKNYNSIMNYIGILYTVLIFAGCFFFVHLIALAIAGFKSIIKKPEEPPEEPPKKKQEPQKIYYIVEKKRARRSTYSEPKEIDFK